MIARARVDEVEFLATANAWFDVCGRLSSIAEPPPGAPAPAWLRSLPPMSVEPTRPGLVSRMRLGCCWFQGAHGRLTAFVSAVLPLTIQLAIEDMELADVFLVHPLLRASLDREACGPSAVGRAPPALRRLKEACADAGMMLICVM